MLTRELPETFHLLSGSVITWYPGLSLGIRAAVLAVSNIVPDQCARVQEYYDAGNHHRAKETYLRLLPLNAAIASRYGIAGLKCAATLAGYEGGYVREPLLELRTADKTAIRQIMKSCGYL